MVFVSIEYLYIFGEHAAEGKKKCLFLKKGIRRFFSSFHTWKLIEPRRNRK